MNKTKILSPKTSSGSPILDAYERVLPPRKQQLGHQISYVYVLCPYCDTWRIHGRAPHETNGLIYRASHCVDCPTEDTGYALQIIGPWTDSVRRRCQGRYKPPAPAQRSRRILNSSPASHPSERTRRTSSALTEGGALRGRGVERQRKGVL